MQKLLEQLTAGASLSLELGGFLLSMLASVAAALAAEFMYELFYERRATGSQLQKSFLLVGPSITFLFICVQLSLPLSLGLLGALSIIRFRTPVKEPEEIGFLMLLIAGSIGLATFNFLFVLILYAVAFVLLLARHWGPLRRRWINRRSGVLLLNLDDETYARQGAALDGLLGRHFSGLRLESIASVEGTTSLHYAFAHAPSGNWPEIQQSIQREVPCRKINVFFSAPGSLV